MELFLSLLVVYQNFNYKYGETRPVSIHAQQALYEAFNGNSWFQEESMDLMDFFFVSW